MTSVAPTPSLRVLGAADTVTGSRYLLEHDGARVLVDCGLFQGYKTFRDRNWLPFPVEPGSVDAVLVTHAHLDHSGYLPALVRDGFIGRVHVTEGTADLLGILLPDSGRLLEEEAEVYRRHGSRHHRHPRALYSERDALASLRLLRPHAFGARFEVAQGVTARFAPAGHIVGAAQIQATIGEYSVHFTRDLGRPADPIMRAPAPLARCDVLVTESTYGDRVHEQADTETELAHAITRVAERSGVVIIPAFAVGRAEALVHHLSRLRHRGAFPDIPIFLNSPMAVDAAQVYRRRADELRLSEEDIAQMTGAVHLVHSVEESKALNRRSGPMVIVSASGMLTGGRVLHHVAAFGPDPRNAIVLTGFQAAGTRGAALADGDRTLRIFGRDVTVGAEVIQLHSMSAHADSDELMRWLGASPVAPGLTLVTHGEPHAADALRIRIDRELGWNVRVPGPMDRIDLEDATAR